jgi:hypothetical protein
MLPLLPLRLLLALLRPDVSAVQSDFMQIYGRQGSPDEVAAVANVSQQDRRAILIDNIRQFYAQQQQAAAEPAAPEVPQTPTPATPSTPAQAPAAPAAQGLSPSQVAQFAQAAQAAGGGRAALANPQGMSVDIGNGFAALYDLPVIGREAVGAEGGTPIDGEPQFVGFAKNIWQEPVTRGTAQAAEYRETYSSADTGLMTILAAAAAPFLAEFILP